MPTTYNEAYKTITDRFEAGWIAAFVPGILGVTTPPPIRYADNETGDLPTTDFCRFVVDPVIERQSSIRDGENGQRYNNEGLIIVQLLMSRDNPQVAEFTRLVGEAAKAIFRGKCFDGGIIFRDVRINRLTPEPKFLRSNMIAEYQFDEIG